jgi:signal transduction histidine kinase
MTRAATNDAASNSTSATERPAHCVIVPSAPSEPTPPDLAELLKGGMGALEQILQALQQSNVHQAAPILDAASRILVETLRYAGALLFIVEDDSLILRSAALQQGREGQPAQLEACLNGLLASEQPFARLNEPLYRDNLTVRALSKKGNRSQQILQSNNLYDLLQPHLGPEEAAKIQKAAKISQALVVPFQPEPRVRGALLVFTYHSTFSEPERELLSVIVQHIALGLRNAQLYWRAEEQRRVAQTFARMAFSASAYLHTLRNQIGSFRTYLSLVQMLPQMKPEQQQEVVASSHKAYEMLNEAAEILDHLHEPWRQHPDEPTDVNDCLRDAMLKVVPTPTKKLSAPPVGGQHSPGLTIHWKLAEDLPPVDTSPEMLTEAFRVLIRNAVDAITEADPRNSEGNLWLETVANPPEAHVPATVSILVQDDGIGIPQNHLSHIFELGWSTKQGRGMGFGLFWVRNFVEGCGGHIDVYSAPQAGSSFRLTLPVSRTLPVSPQAAGSK